MSSCGSITVAEHSDWLVESCGTSFDVDPTCTSGDVFKACVPVMNITFVDNPPYAMFKDGAATGYLIGLLKDFVRKSCCNDSYSINYKQYLTVNRTQETLIEHCSNITNGCNGILGVMGNPSDVSISGKPYQSLLPVDDVYYVTVRGEIWRHVVNAIMESITLMWPLFLLIIAMCVVAGALVWCCEKMHNKNEFPQNFFKGTNEGFWWGFISITTVGYGDKKTLSFCGRLFSVFWILLGICIFAVIIVLVNYSVNEAVNQSKVDIIGQNVGYLDHDVNAMEAIKAYDALPYAATHIHDLVTYVATGRTSGIALDKNLFVGGYKNSLKGYQIDWMTEKVLSTDTHHGMLFFPIVESSECIESSRWQECGKAYFDYNKKRMQVMRANYTFNKNVIDRNTNFIKTPRYSIPMAQTGSREFYIFIGTLLGAIILTLIVGAIYELALYLSNRPNRLDKNSGYDEEDEQENNELNESRFESTILQTITVTDLKIDEFQKELKNDILNMSRDVRRNLAEQRNANNKYKLYNKYKV